MDSKQKVSWTEYELTPEGIYEAEIVKVEEATSEFGEIYQFYFKLNCKNSRGEEIEISRPISKKLSPKSKLYELVAALDGKKPTREDYPDGVTVAELIGKKCRVMIRNIETDSGTFSRIQTFLTLNKKE